MIELINIKNTASYSAMGAQLCGLNRINYIYGANGCGKTTISRVIEAPESYSACSITWLNGQALERLVYNRDFIDRNFAVQMPGIFTLGEHDADILNKIDAGRSERIRFEHDIAAKKKVLDGEDGKSGKNGELLKLRADLEEQCWKLKDKHDSYFKDALTGARNAKSAFCTKILGELASNSASLHTLDDLKNRAKIIFEKGLQKEIAIQSVDTTELASLESAPILVKKVIGKGDVDIAALIDQLSNSDWVKDGLGYLSASSKKCPFCQQKIDDDLSRRISDYFDVTYEHDMGEIKKNGAGYQSYAQALLHSLRIIAEHNSRYIDADQFRLLVDQISARLALNVEHYLRKQKEPSSVVLLEKNAEIYARIASIVATANKEINLHNAMVDDLGHQKQVLTSEIWKYLLDDAKENLNNYSTKKLELDKTVESLNVSLKEKRRELSEINQSLRDNESLITSVQPTVDEINALLASFGFNGFKLATAGEDKNFYEILRLDGTNAITTLSEGEKTFITFLYFYHLIRGSTSESGTRENRVVVFDDPVSSLDSDVLFIVSSLIKRVIQIALEKNSAIRQVFILTHNIYFHKEVSFDPKRKTLQSYESFWVVKKGEAGSVAQSFKHNPISTSYELLWSEVKNENRSKMTIQNTLRRILENYFKILGNLDKDKIIEKFQGRDKIICASLFSWINDGSHNAHDDLYLSGDDAAINNYLRVFELIFGITDNKGHYNMMMGIAPA